MSRKTCLGGLAAATVFGLAWALSPNPHAETRPPFDLQSAPIRLQNGPIGPLRGPIHSLQSVYSLQDVASASSTDTAVLDEQSLMARYCISCHNSRLKTAGLALDQLDLNRAGEHAETWEKVIAKVRSQAMPPLGRPRPSPKQVAGFVGALERRVDEAAVQNPRPGRSAPHRLNRTEYANVIRDLLGFELDVTSMLPEDEVGYGFDNNADVLSVSTDLVERYLSAARKIAAAALGDPTISSAVEIYSPPSDDRQSARSDEAQSFGTRGGITIERYFPVSAEHTIRIVMRRPSGSNDTIVGLRGPRETIEVRVDGVLVKEFAFGGMDAATAAGYGRGAIPFDDPRGQFDLRLPIVAGQHHVSVAFREVSVRREDVKHEFPTQNYSFTTDGNAHARIARVELGGPYAVTGRADSPSRSQILTCRPASQAKEDDCATTILRTLMRRAYRRPVTQADLAPALAFYREGRAEKDFDTGIQRALERVLVSPQFLFRVETSPEGVDSGEAHRLSDIELASRLSFFLWSSIPDDELLGLAERGQLKKQPILEGQVRRLLADPRAAAFTRGFSSQWLWLRSLRTVRRDIREYPEFDDELRAAFRQETEMLFEDQVRSDRGVIDLLTADYTFVNQRLAEHYGMRRVKGSHFRRVPVTDPNRIGLLGHASIHTVTSYANRTAPTIRGKWLLENFLGAPPPAPPADVPALSEEPAKSFETMRQRLDEHRKNPACSACHASIDPLGFALENFDAIGQWRVKQGNAVLDVSGELNGVKFSGPSELRALLVARQDEFATTVTEKLLTYAIGRGAEYFDMPSIRHITRAAAANGYRWSTLILEIVNSQPFQMRRATS